MRPSGVGSWALGVDGRAIRRGYRAVSRIVPLRTRCGWSPTVTVPTTFELQERGRAFPPNFLHDSWRDFLYRDTELEP